jgi:hypothetical protein
MKHTGMMFMVLVFLVGVPAALAQDGSEYSDPSGQYKITLSGDWRAVSYNDAVGRQKTEFVYRDRSEGLLKIGRETLTGSLAEMVHREEENLKIYRTGFEGASTEQFGGGPLTGYRLSFFSIEGNRKTANTFYYLQSKNAVWILRFTGKRGSLDAIRNITDQTARSFRPL